MKRGTVQGKGDGPLIGVVTAHGDDDDSSRELLTAARRHGRGEYVDPLSLTVDLRGAMRRVLINGRCVDDYAAFVMRGYNHCGEIDLQFETFELIQAQGIPVVNSPQALSIAESKSVTLYLLAGAGLPIPRTLSCQTVEMAREALREFGSAVIKPLFGALGMGVERIQWPDREGRLPDYLDEWRALCMQEFIPTGGRDIRAFIVGGRVVGAVQRIAQGCEWRTNVHQGGMCQPYRLSAQEEDMCLRAAELVGLDYTGLDILPGPNGPLLLEVNGAPQWHGLAAATGLDVADAVIAHVLTLAARRERTATAAC